MLIGDIKGNIGIYNILNGAKYANLPSHNDKVLNILQSATTYQ